MFAYLDLGVVTAAATGDFTAVQAYMDANPHQLNCRSIFQSTLLHVAARNGHLAIVKDLLQRGITIDAPDHGGLGRTPLHWACEAGHVEVVELLVSLGANTDKLLGLAVPPLETCPRVANSIGVCMAPCASVPRSYTHQQTTCPQKGHDKGQVYIGSRRVVHKEKRFAWLIHADASCDDSLATQPTNHAVQLALERPCWTPENNHMWPARFKEMVRLLLLSVHRTQEEPAPGAASGGEQIDRGVSKTRAGAAATQPQQHQSVPLPWDCCRDIIARSAYPVSIWL